MEHSLDAAAVSFRLGCRSTGTAGPETRQAHDEAQAPFPPWEIRRDRLQRLSSLIVEQERAIEDAIDADFGGRPRLETQIAEVFPSLAELRGALRQGRRWMKPRSAGVSKWFLPARAHVMPRPLGVVGIIVPWNYPLYLAVGPLAGALAAGNRAMVKMSEATPRFSQLFADLVARRFDPTELAIITGGPDVAAQFSALPFDHLLFTGSTGVGRQVMGAAAQNLTPVTLELGGKSPAVVAPGYPIARAAERILAGKLLNAGQTCIAPDYLLVPRTQVPALVEAAAAQARRMYPRGLADPDYCSIIKRRSSVRCFPSSATTRSTRRWPSSMRSRVRWRSTGSTTITRACDRRCSRRMRAECVSTRR